MFIRLATGQHNLTGSDLYPLLQQCFNRLCLVHYFKVASLWYAKNPLCHLVQDLNPKPLTLKYYITWTTIIGSGGNLYLLFQQRFNSRGAFSVHEFFHVTSLG